MASFVLRPTGRDCATVVGPLLIIISNFALRRLPGPVHLLRIFWHCLILFFWGGGLEFIYLKHSFGRPSFKTTYLRSFFASLRNLKLIAKLQAVILFLLLKKWKSEKVESKWECANVMKVMNSSLPAVCCTPRTAAITFIPAAQKTKQMSTFCYFLKHF